jgi:hypothetical protein
VKRLHSAQRKKAGGHELNGLQDQVMADRAGADNPDSHQCHLAYVTDAGARPGKVAGHTAFDQMEILRADREDTGQAQRKSARQGRDLARPSTFSDAVFSDDPAAECDV